MTYYRKKADFVPHTPLILDMKNQYFLIQNIPIQCNLESLTVTGLQHGLPCFFYMFDNIRYSLHVLSVQFGLAWSWLSRWASGRFGLWNENDFIKLVRPIDHLTILPLDQHSSLHLALFQYLPNTRQNRLGKNYLLGKTCLLNPIEHR